MPVQIFKLVCPLAVESNVNQIFSSNLVLYASHRCATRSYSYNNIPYTAYNRKYCK